MSGNHWASVIVLATFLALVVRAYAAQRLPKRRIILMAVIWLVVIATLTLIFVMFPQSGE